MNNAAIFSVPLSTNSAETMSRRSATKYPPPPGRLFVRRQPPGKRPIKRLFAAIRGRNQRAATATADGSDADDRGLKVSRGFTIIFAFHIVAIGLYFVHLNFLNGHTNAPSSSATAAKPGVVEAAPADASSNLTCTVQAGDNWEKIAAREGVKVEDLRAANAGTALAADATLVLPAKAAAAATPEPARAPKAAPAAASDSGLVAAEPAGSAARGVLVKPKVLRETAGAASATTTGGRTYVVRPGDSLWQISKRHKVDQAELMKRNNLTDPNKLRAGMKLILP